MRQIITAILVFSSLLFSRIAGVKKLELLDPYGRELTTYQTWCKDHITEHQPTTISNVLKINKERQNVVDLVINSKIYPEITSEINTFVQDLTDAGYSVQIDTISGMSHTALRTHLSTITDLVGAIFIGEVPVAWFETNGFGGWEEFPHDLYFCDLNGTYIDADGDGIYDNHTGSVAPEIWVGRIYARNLTWGNEVELLKRYFKKNHLYRVDSLSVPQRGLTFIDDDWSSWTTCGLDYIYSNVVVINDGYQTIASNYRNELLQGYEWIQLCAHSSPWGSTFKYGYSGYRGTVFNYEIFTLEPHALFYNLFACSGTRFVEENHSAGWYIFIDPYGLLAVGSTKTGSMLYFEDFYYPIGQQNMSIGDGFKTWFTQWGEMDWDWFYGMNILGDPTLKPKGQTKNISQEKICTPTKPSEDWQTPETVAPDPESDGFPQISINNDGRIWVVWQTGRTYENGRSDIYGAYNYGGNWSSGMNIGSYVYWDYCPAIGFDNQHRPVTVWAGYNEGQYDLYYSYYTGSWSTRQLLHSSDPAYDINPMMIKDNSGRLWAVWESRRNLNCDIYGAYFNGSTWTTPQQITNFAEDEKTPVLAIDSLDRLWVFYNRRYADKSEIWGSYYNGSQWLSSGPVSGSQEYAYHPACAVSGNEEIWVAWHSLDSGDADIYASRFNGSTWSSPVQVTTASESDLFPSLATHINGTVCLAYQSKSGGDWNIYFAYCTDSTWSTPSPVAEISGADINPQIACDSTGGLWVCWQSYSSGNWEILVSHQPDFGAAEQKENRLSENRLSVFPSVFTQNVRIKTSKPYRDVKIFDAKGSLITTLNSGIKKQISWIPKGLPEGTYFITLSDESGTTTEKVLFLHRR